MTGLVQMAQTRRRQASGQPALCKAVRNRLVAPGSKYPGSPDPDLPTAVFGFPDNKETQYSQTETSRPIRDKGYCGVMVRIFLVVKVHWKP